jgi:starch synthase
MSEPSGPRVLLVASEVLPLAKTGGLGDVAAALPAALRQLDVDARVLIPAYPGVIEQIRGEPVTGPLHLLPEAPAAQVFRGLLTGAETPVYALDCPVLYRRSGGPYLDENGRDWVDNAQRFALLSRTAALFGAGEGLAGWSAQILHSNDWQTGLTSAYLVHTPRAHARSVFTIHNIGFQGNFSRETFPRLGLPPATFGLAGIEYFGRVSFLKGGIVYSDRVTAVSPTYAEEIQTSAYGDGMEGVVAAHRHKLLGVLNGIDTRVWDPSADPYLPKPYDARRLPDKAVSKRALQERLGLVADAHAPLLGLVTRLTWQKGVDLVLSILDRLLDQPVQVALLGAGDRAFETRWRQAAADMPGRVGVLIGYDEGVAHLIEAGADIFLMPSRYEPCGLNQMYSMRYGTPPVVRRTGGLADSVTDTTPASMAEGTATGFVFDNANEAELFACLLRALMVHRDRSTWRALQRQGMARDFSWEQSAGRYLGVYRELIGVRW